MDRARAPRVILVTDPAWPDEAILATVDAIASALPRGSFCVQLRDKTRERASLRAFASRLRERTGARGAWLLVNGDAAIAREVGADGVHLGGGAISIAEARSALGAGAWISVAAHSDDAVRLAIEQGADAALVSPIFATGAKVPRGLDALRSARLVAGGRFLLYALGGVTPGNARGCAEAGADGAALVRALLGSAAPAQAARAVHDAVAASW